MIKRNPNLAKLKSGYLFPEINKRKQKFLLENPSVKLISLGIGDTTEPIPHPIAKALSQAAEKLSTIEGYTGYGPEQGYKDLRQQIATKIYGNKIDAEEVFISDGAKCDIGRLQMLFGRDVSIAIQDPVYPVYLDGSIMQGVDQIFYMPCTPENNFFPDLEKIPRADIIYFCSPNNPTGAAATKEQLQKLVAFAKKNRSIIVFDSAYSNYIQDANVPKSIFEIEGAKEVSLEISSLSKMVGFTGVRLGWSVVPHELKYEDGTPVNKDWNRLISTIFNGASNIVQQGGIAALEDAGQKEIAKLTHFYLENAKIIRNCLEKAGFNVYGGINAPYLWVEFKNRKSWDVFQEILEKYHVITTPGAGFGSNGEGFVRFTAYGNRNNILTATDRLQGLKC